MKSTHLPSFLRLISAMILIGLILAACAPVVTSTSTATAPTSAAAISIAPTLAAPTSLPSPTPPAKLTPAVEATSSPANPAGKVTYKIVPGESKVTYEVGETFLNQNNRFYLAQGVTTVVSGEVYGDKTNPSTASLGAFVIDISKFKSDSDRRDSYIRSNGLESSKYPTAKFVPGAIESLPTAYQEGNSYTFKITGDLTIKTTTRPVTWTVTTKLTGDTLSGQATTQLLMSDFKVGPISILGVLNTEDQVKLIFDFVAKP